MQAWVHTLCACISKLCQCGMEELILLPEWLLLFVRVCLGNLKGHVLIGHFGNRRDEENARKDEDKDANGEIDPLNALEGIDIVTHGGEEDI